MIDLLCYFCKKDHPIQLNKEFLLHLQWWDHLLVQWHSISFWLYLGISPAVDSEVSSDAAGSLVFGVYFQGHWFVGSRDKCQVSQSIAYKELFPTVIAACLWGLGWSKQHVLFHSDNATVVHILNSRTSRTPSIMQLLCHLMLSAARDSFSFSAKHIPGINNQVTDALSHFRWQEFCQLAPAAQPSPTPIPPQLLLELITSF